MANFSIPKLVKEKIPKSYFNQQCCRRTTATVGVHIPIYHKYVLPNDEFKIDKIAAKIKSQPFVVPLMGAFRVQLDWFFEPLTNLYGFMDNNDTLGTADILKQDLFTLSLYPPCYKAASSPMTTGQPWFIPKEISDPSSDIFNIGHVSPATLLNFLGFPSDWDATTCNITPYASFGILNGTYDEQTRQYGQFRADAWLAYWDIYRSYYTNKQCKKGAIYTGEYSISRDFSAYEKTPIQYIDQSVFDGMYKELRMMPAGSRNLSDGGSYEETAPNLFRFMKQYAPHIRGIISKQWLSSDTKSTNFKATRSFTLPFTGLGCAQYRPDVYQSVMLPATPEVFSSIEATLAGSGDVATFTIDALRVASHYQKLLDLYDASGGQFSKWINMQFDVDIDSGLDRPILLQTSHQYITVDDVTALSATNQNSDGTGQEVRVGEQFGQINTGAGFRGVKFRSRYHGVLMCIATIVPEVDYSLNYDQNMFDTKFADLYTPAMSQLGYEGMTVGDFFACLPLPNTFTWDNSQDLTYYGLRQHIYGLLDQTSSRQTDSRTVCGRNVHWWRYMSDVSRTFGSMSCGGTLESWTLQRRNYTTVASDTPDKTITGGAGLTTSVYSTLFNVTPYLNPADWNYFFAYQQSGAENWQMQFAFDVEAKRPIPKYVLGRIV